MYKSQPLSQNFIFMKFGTKVLNWILNDSRSFYLKQTLDGEIIEFGNTNKFQK